MLLFASGLREVLLSKLKWQILSEEILIGTAIAEGPIFSCWIAIGCEEFLILVLQSLQVVKE